jgi:hypothetical protein
VNILRARTVFFFLLLFCVEPFLAARQVRPLTPPSVGVHVLAARHDLSPPLRTLKPSPDSAGSTAGEDDEETEGGDRTARRRARAQSGIVVSDPIVQELAGSIFSLNQGVQFDGISASSSGWVVPDTNGAIGPTQFVEFLNGVWAVYDRTNGNLLFGPEKDNLVWQGFGGVCESNNNGDPIGQYDKQAGRWVLTQHAVPPQGQQPYQCVAVSETSDATGAFYRYAFPLPLDDLPDYPKISTWVDAYYYSADEFLQSNLQQEIGPYVCAFDRASMLQGLDATSQCFQLGPAYLSLLSADWDGATPPPSGSPEYFMSLGVNSLNLWQFHVDFVNPANTTFTGPVIVPVAAFTEACGDGGACIPQPGVTQRLDSIGDRIMYRLAYRNFGDHESLVANHAVDANGEVGLRWYEIRSPGSNPVVYQQQTYADRGANRWMGSISMDHVGDIAIGYSGSSKKLYPSVRVAGRLASDPLNKLKREIIVLTGGGAEDGSYRWGDYNSLLVDPLDDCTFWFTAEYFPSNGSYNWNTHITSFSIQACTGNLNNHGGLASSDRMESIPGSRPAASRR